MTFVFDLQHYSLFSKSFRENSVSKKLYNPLQCISILGEVGGRKMNTDLLKFECQIL